MREEQAVMQEPQMCNDAETRSTAKYDDYKPSRMECLRNYEIGIKFLSSGCIITVGCKQVAFSTTTEAMKAFTDYINDPYETRQRWEKIFQEEE